VMVRPAATYEVGDVVAYRSASTNAVMLHRVIEKSAGLLTLQGDNNPEPDVDQPRSDEVIGKLLFHVPQGAKLVRTVGLGLLMSVAGLAFTSGRRRAGSFHLNWLQTRAGIATTTGAVFLLAGIGLSMLPPRSTSETVSLVHQGSFSYSAVQPHSIYPNGKATTGQTVFTANTRVIKIGFGYTLDSSVPVQSHGSMALRARISDGQGWSRTWSLGKPMRIKSTTGRVNANLNLDRVARIRSEFEKASGIPRVIYRIEILAKVLARGDLATQPFADKFTPVLPLEYDGYSVKFTAQPIEPLIKPSAEFQVAGAISHAVPATVSVAGKQFPARTAGVMMGILGLAAFGYARFSGKSTGTREAMSRRHSDRVVAVDHVETGSAMILTSERDFLRLAGLSEGPILECRDAWGTTWMITSKDATFIYREGTREQFPVIDLDGVSV
jgi:hypothetical protein